MGHLSSVTVLHGPKENDGNIASFLFVVVGLLHDPIKEFAAHHFFRHEVVVLAFFKDIVESNNVGMFELFKNGNFILQGDFIFFGEFGFGNDLDGIGLSRFSIGSFFDYGKSTGTELHRMEKSKR